MSQMVTCPRCQSLLRSQKPIPPGVNLRCPDCREAFPAPLVVNAKLFGPPFVIAVAASLLLGASIIAAALIFTSRRPIPVPEHQASDLSEDEALTKRRKELADVQAKLIQEQGKLKRQMEHGRLRTRAESVLAKNNYADAKKLFTRALDLMPGDADTVKGLVTAEAGLLTAARAQQDEAKRKTEVAQLLADAKKAMVEKKFAFAVARLEAARGLTPASRPILDALTAAQSALDGDRAEKKKLADFRTHLDAGKTAMKAERYPDAVKEYMAALRLMPDDLEAQQGQKLAEGKIAALADKEKRQNAFTALTDRARVALGGKRFKEAIQTLEAARRLFPDDRDAQRDLRKAKADLLRAKKDNASLLARADDAIKIGRLSDAREMCQDAVKNWAEDATADKALRLIERRLEEAKTIQLNLQATYLTRIQAAQAAYVGGNYATAVATYAELARLMPGDPEIAQALRRARIALERRVGRRLEFDRTMKAGNAAALSRNYGDAVTYYQKALRLDPDNIQAQNALSKARYNKAVVDGQRALARRRKSDAIQAFKAALDEAPGDLIATNGLNQARLLR